MAKTPETLRVYPHPDLPAGDYIPGIGEAGLELPAYEAQALIDGGWVTTDASPARETEQPAAAADEPATPAKES